MKALLYITNYDGNSKIDHVNEILKNANMFNLDVDVIIYTTEELRLEDHDNLNIEVVIKPKVFSNSKYAASWQPEPEFIWIHRSDILTKINEYDIFIHVEDDIRITNDNFKQFIKYSFDDKFDNYIMGNILYEIDGDRKLLPQFHDPYKGIGEIIELNGEYFMKPKNKHQSSYLITQKQLKKLINGGHMNPTPKLVGGYNIKCSAMSELYTTNVLTKLIPLSILDSSLTEHLSGKYVKIWKNKCQYLSEIINEIKTLINHD